MTNTPDLIRYDDFTKYHELKWRLKKTVIDELVGLATVVHLNRVELMSLNDQIDLLPDLQPRFGERLSSLQETKDKAQAELRAREILAVQEIKFSKFESQLIDKASQQIDQLKELFPQVDESQIKLAYQQYLIAFLKYSIFYQDIYTCMDNVSEVLNDYYSPIFMELMNKYGYSPEKVARVVTKQTLSSMDFIISSNNSDSFSEFDDFNVNLFDTTPLDIIALEEIIWPIDADQKDSLINLWASLTPDEKMAVTTDPTGYEASLLLSYKLAKPLDNHIEELGKILFEATRNAGFNRYIKTKITN